MGLLVTVSVKLERLAVGSAKFARSGIDDLLSSTEGGKHDYDWYVGLIVPGETWFAKGSDCLGSPLTLDNQSPFSALIKDILEWIVQFRQPKKKKKEGTLILMLMAHRDLL